MSRGTRRLAGTALASRRTPPGPARGGEIVTGRRFLALDRIDLVWLVVLVFMAFGVRVLSPLYPDWLTRPFSGAPVTSAGLGFPADADPAADAAAGHAADEECAGAKDTPVGKPDAQGVPVGPGGIAIKVCGFVFDEIYFPVDAAKDLHQPALDYFDPEPPLSKLLMAPALACGTSYLPWSLTGGTGCEANFVPWRWRIAPAVAGSLFVGLIYLIARRLRRDRLFAVLAAGFVCFDGLALVESRTGVIDMIAVFFVGLLYYVFLLHWQARTRRQWLSTLYVLAVVAGLAFGAKLTAIAPMAIAGGFVGARLLEPVVLRSGVVRRFLARAQRDDAKDARGGVVAEASASAPGLGKPVLPGSAVATPLTDRPEPWQVRARRSVVRISAEGRLWRSASGDAGIERYVLIVLPVVAAYLAVLIANRGGPGAHLTAVRGTAIALLIVLAGHTIWEAAGGRIAALGVRGERPSAAAVVALVLSGALALWPLAATGVHLTAVATMVCLYFALVQYSPAAPVLALGLGALLSGVVVGVDLNWMTVSAALAGFLAPRLLEGRLWAFNGGWRGPGHSMLFAWPVLVVPAAYHLDGSEFGALQVTGAAASALLVGVLFGSAWLVQAGRDLVRLCVAFSLCGFAAIATDAPLVHLSAVLLASLLYCHVLERCDPLRERTWWPVLLAMGTGFGIVLGDSLNWLTVAAAVLGVVGAELLALRSASVSVGSSDVVGEDVGAAAEGRGRAGWSGAEHYVLALLLGAVVFVTCFARYSTIDHTVYRFTGCSLANGGGLQNDAPYTETKPQLVTIAGVQLADLTAVAGNAWDEMAAGLEYHSNECHDHPFASRWYTWPLDIKPVLFYLDSDDSVSTPLLDAQGQPHDSFLLSSVSNGSNPPLSWLGVIAVLWCAWRMTRRLRVRWRVGIVALGVGSLALMMVSFHLGEHTLLDGPALDPVRVPSSLWFILGMAGVATFCAIALACGVIWREFVAAFVVIGYLVSWLMWAPGNEKRVLFFYHALGSLPFVALAAAYALTALRRTRVQVGARVFSLAPLAYAAVLVVAAGFVFFYPMWTGLPQFSNDRSLRLWPWLDW